jgi:hypothetical protein
MPKAFARIDVRGLNRLRREVSEGLNGKTGGPIDTMLKNWGLFYLRKCQDAFRRNSAGGGDWPPLALVTIEKTRDLPRKGILRINSDVYFALFPGEAGNVFRRIRSSLRRCAKRQSGRFRIWSARGREHMATTNPITQIRTAIEAAVGAHWDSLPNDNAAKVKVNNRWGANRAKPAARLTADFPAVDIRPAQEQNQNDIKFSSGTGVFVRSWELGLATDERPWDDPAALDEAEWQLVRSRRSAAR